ncbi:MAG: hypothetical protein K9M57_02680 [Phycisphaerae bacterium]|nr:hypothetical protein [Phycisphaerae bacterium]
MMYDELFEGGVEILPGCDLGEVTRALPGGPGVCLLGAADDRPVLLLFGANVRLLVRRRLAEDQAGAKSKRTALRPIVRKIWYRRCYSPFETKYHYFQIARAVYPDRFGEFFPRLDVWFLRVAPGDAYPCFSKVRRVEADGGRYWGPFFTGKSVDGYLEILQSVFKLCRCPQILAQAPHGKGCSYAQMGQCVPVCDGTVSAKQYKAVIGEVMGVLDGGWQLAVERMRHVMQSHSAALEFEKAQGVHRQMKEMEKLGGHAYRWVGAMEKFSVLAFERGPMVKVEPDENSAAAGEVNNKKEAGETNDQTEAGEGQETERVGKVKKRREATVIPFVIGPGWVVQVEPMRLAGAVEGCRGVLDHLNLAWLQTGALSLDEEQEQLLAWVTHLLYKDKRKDGLFIRDDGDLTAERVAGQVVDYFDQPERVKESGKLQLDAYSLEGQDDSPGE